MVGANAQMRQFGGSSLFDMFMNQAQNSGEGFRKASELRTRIAQDQRSLNDRMFDARLDFSKNSFNSNNGFRNYQFNQSRPSNGALGLAALLNIGVPIYSGLKLNQLQRDADNQMFNAQRIYNFGLEQPNYNNLNIGRGFNNV